ncbi:uncharacterized protein MONOS_11984 [Monocercomonoides exilis]|uniref:uncharacterized protein n=1 Tax=Monocercomonoides exilis TaxID=2049356 RepID=UPI00355A7C26|nr:hypothetical protein MONOS_11984 [Monocercomonoides exilis]|eukprot:MONOS_11984.1-p1 / transcript=MONOS_11984.1 / gene=MONOS_11984 / organism=Monocercomonoides_exilis_PA203 / gene_product=unspecified product / transcript_product=unspecified product / location=Mono_scaffold00633:5517-6339(-) / protein_length=258 / sequence_SO=supercontig / SO=protein_coding / is_pseudo=false
MVKCADQLLHYGGVKRKGERSLAIDSSNACAVEASHTSAGAMDDIERRLRIVVPEAAGVYGLHMPLSLQLLLSPRALQTLRGYVVTQRAVLYVDIMCAYDVCISVILSVLPAAPLFSIAALKGKRSLNKWIFSDADENAFPSINDLFNPSLQILLSPQLKYLVMELEVEVMEQGVAVCEEKEIVKKALEAAGLKMEDVVLWPATIVLAVLEEREEAEEGERRGKEGEEYGEEKGEEDEGRNGGDGNEEKVWYPTANR